MCFITIKNNPQIKKKKKKYLKNANKQKCLTNIQIVFNRDVFKDMARRKHNKHTFKMKFSMTKIS